MIKREVIKGVLGGEKPPYVPWSFKFTKKLKEAFMQYYDTDDPVMMDLIVEAEAFGVHLVFSKNHRCFGARPYGDRSSENSGVRNAPHRYRNLLQSAVRIQ